MISDSFSARPLSEYDLCVVGSGPAGTVLALEMAKAGKRVLVLESGGHARRASQQALSDAEILDQRQDVFEREVLGH